MAQISILDLTKGTLTNEDAIPVKNALTNSLKKGEKVVLSFKGVNLISSSFLNSSIGEIISEFGILALKNKIKITNYTPALAEMIKGYINRVISKDEMGRPMVS